jgi:hypothetical protein
MLIHRSRSFSSSTVRQICGRYNTSSSHYGKNERRIRLSATLDYFPEFSEIHYLASRISLTKIQMIQNPPVMTVMKASQRKWNTPYRFLQLQFMIIS